ncbi:hypothetical protein BJ742DRAFT_771567 [Cladochytrium replicatum]|nr:hypothetical protein BJ742DRAFT_771567 [Cladochytrium replicatum]
MGHTLVVLNSNDEEAINKRLLNDASVHCEDVVKAFVECSKHGTFKVLFACQDAKKKMDRCVSGFVTEEERDRRREELLRSKRVFVEKTLLSGGDSSLKLL